MLRRAPMPTLLARLRSSEHDALLKNQKGSDPGAAATCQC